MKQNGRFIQQFPVEKNNQHNYIWNPEQWLFLQTIYSDFLFYNNGSVGPRTDVPEEALEDANINKRYKINIYNWNKVLSPTRFR
jgi:hypothetical protein